MLDMNSIAREGRGSRTMRGVDGLGRGSGATWSTRSCETEPRVPRYVGCGCRRDVEQHVVAEMGYSKHVLLGARRFTARRQEGKLHTYYCGS